MLTLCLTVILITTFTSLLLSENPPTLQLQNASTNISLLVNENIFYQDPDNNILLIDFKEVKEKLTKVQVIKGQEVIMEDRVEDLAEDSIYEIDLNTYAQGNYTITLITTSQKLIEEEISIISKN